MKAIGIRARAKDIVYCVVEETETICYIHATEKLIVPQALEMPDRLSYVRTSFESIIKEYDVENAGIRIAEMGKNAYCENYPSAARVIEFDIQVKKLEKTEDYRSKSKRLELYSYINSLTKHNRKKCKVEQKSPDSFISSETGHNRKMISLIDTSLTDFSNILTQLYLLHGHKIVPVMK